MSMSTVLDSLRPHRKHAEAELSESEERALAFEYERAMGMHLAPDAQAELFKSTTEGAPRVRRMRSALRAR